MAATVPRRCRAPPLAAPFEIKHHHVNDKLTLALFQRTLPDMPDGTKLAEFTNAQIDDPKNLALLRAVFTDPDFLKPQRTTAQVTERLAQTIVEVAKSLQKRESVELVDARTRKEMKFAQRKKTLHRPFPQPRRFLLLRRGHRPVAEKSFLRHRQDRH